MSVALKPSVAPPAYADHRDAGALPHIEDNGDGHVFLTASPLPKLFSGSCADTSGKGLLDFLLADPSALDEVLALYGFGLHCLDTATPIASDAELISDAANLFAAHAEALKGGKRDHRDTIAIAEKARPVVQGYSGIIAEADRFRGVGRAA